MINVNTYLDSAQIVRLKEQLELVIRTLETDVHPAPKAFVLWSTAVNLQNLIKELKGE